MGDGRRRLRCALGGTGSRLGDKFRQGLVSTHSALSHWLHRKPSGSCLETKFDEVEERGGGRKFM